MKSRSIKVFLSSTFRDFMEERHLLVTEVFPELRRRFRSRQVDVVEVDLRWGITAEQAERGEVLPICLAEIDRCRPFFIGMLGERYGWVPEAAQYDASLLEERAWLKEHAGGRSVTELEILHGVLNNPAMAGRAFFYFRAPEASRALGDAGVSPEPEMQSRLQALKTRVRESSFPVLENYPNAQAMKEAVLNTLTSVLDEAFPWSEVPDAHERQRLEHDAFGQSRLAAYRPPPDAWALLDTLFEPEDTGMRVVLGESGGGKSARLASWWQHLAEEGRLPEFAFVHYIGGTPESTRLANVLDRLMQAIRQHARLQEVVPPGLLEKVQALPAFLQALADAGGGLLVLDALNQFADTHDGTLWWLPTELPEGLRLVFSTLPGPAYKALQARGWLGPSQVVRVRALSEPERETLVGHYLNRYTKTLAADLTQSLAQHPRCANPLFLRVVLEEVRQRSSHEGLRPMLEQLLQSPDLPALFVKVLKQLEAEHDRERPHLVRQALGFLAVARRGLSEPELLELLSAHPQSPQAKPLPRSLWAPLFLALEASLLSRDGQLGFFHDYLLQAVQREYLDEAWERHAVHGRLGEVALAWPDSQGLHSASLTHYALQHGLHHLLQAGRTADALRLFMNAEFREASVLASGHLQGLVEDGCALAGALLGSNGEAQPSEADQHQAWQVLGLLATEPGRIRQANPQALEAAATAHDWPTVAARAGLAEGDAQRLLLACRAALAAQGQSPAPSATSSTSAQTGPFGQELLEAAARWAARLPSGHASTRLWQTLSHSGAPTAQP